MSKLRLRVRFDYEKKEKKRRLLGARDSLELAEEYRQQKVNLMRNIPVQGIEIEDIDMSQEVYGVINDLEDIRVSYAPVIITFSADSLETAVKYLMKEEFRIVEFLEPQDITLSRLELERLMMRINEELLSFKALLERKRDYWK